MLLISILLSMQSVFMKAQDSGWYPEFLEPVVEQVVQTAPMQHLEVLDIGTGPGKLPEMLIKKDTSLHITGIDIDTGMIDAARQRLQHKNVRFEYEKINAPLDFADQQYDVVTFCSVLFLVDDSVKNLLMNEALRVLKPNGKIIVLTPSGERSFLSAFAEVWRFPFTAYNWTFLIWRAFTSHRGGGWQKNKWLENYVKQKKLTYQTSLVFNKNSSLEIITKSSN